MYVYNIMYVSMYICIRVLCICMYILIRECGSVLYLGITKEISKMY